MAERIPHLTALRAFEAAARALSFQDAARELGLSPSAVSHQIRTLETYLDIRLFNRMTRRIELTEAGHALRPGVGRGFREIEGAVRQVRSIASGSVIVVSAGPAMTSKWLVPRLYEFEERHPAVEVRVTTSMRSIDLTRENVDIGIRHGIGTYEGLDSVRLFGESYAPLCAPGFLDTASPALTGPEALLHHRLLTDDSAALPGEVPGWTDWFAEAGVDGAAESIGRGSHFRQTDHAIQAALDGAGILLGRVALAAPDMAAGRLVHPFGPELQSPYGYFFVTRPGRRREKAVGAFLEWLQERVATMPFMPK